MTVYTATLINNSSRKGHMCLYQAQPSGVGSGVTAWLTKACRPGTTVSMSWSPEYCFFWSEMETVASDVSYQAFGTLDADPDDLQRNGARFTRDEYGYGFEAGAKTNGTGSLTIFCGDIPNNRALIGIGMAGRATMALPALAHMNFTFVPVESYRVTFGDYTQGKLLDVRTVNPSSIQLPFSKERPDITAEYDSEGDWHLR